MSGVCVPYQKIMMDWMSGHSFAMGENGEEMGDFAGFFSPPNGTKVSANQGLPLYLRLLKFQEDWIRGSHL